MKAVHSPIERRRGFTFAELLAAMMFVAIVIPVAVGGLTIANRAGVVAERKRVAARLADRVLTEMALTEDWVDGETAGDFGEEWPGYEWEIVDEEWLEDTQILMRVLTAVVHYQVQGQDYTVSLSTLVEDSSDEVG